MTNQSSNHYTYEARWAHFRFTIIGPLLSAPPEKGLLQYALCELAQKIWRHGVLSHYPALHESQRP